MTKMLIFSLCSTWTNRRQPWGRWTTVGWGSTSRFLHQNICVGTKLVIITMFRNWYCFYSIYAELWTYKFSFNHLIDIFMQYCCKKSCISWFLFLQLEISIAEMEKANSRFDFLSQFFHFCVYHTFTFILFSLFLFQACGRECLRQGENKVVSVRWLSSLIVAESWF